MSDQVLSNAAKIMANHRARRDAVDKPHFDVFIQAYKKIGEIESYETQWKYNIPLDARNLSLSKKIEDFLLQDGWPEGTFIADFHGVVINVDGKIVEAWIA